MKKIGIVICFCLLFTLPVGAQTEPDTVMQEAYTGSGLEELYHSLSHDVQETLEQWGIDPEGLFAGEGLNFSGVLKTLGEIVSQSVKNPLSALGMGIGVLLLCGLMDTILPEKQPSMSGTVTFFAGLGMTAAYVIPAGYTLSKTASTLQGMGGFMLAFVPVYAGMLILSGKTLTAGGSCTMVFGCCQVLVHLAKGVMVPLVGMFQALAVSECTLAGVNPVGFSSAVKKTVTWMLGILVTVFTGVLSLTGIINAAGDSMAQRTTRYFIGNMVPVIGGAISESMATLQGCFSLLKTGGGVLGLGVVAVMALPVVLELLLWRVANILLVSFAQVMGNRSLAGLLQTMGEGINLLFSILISCLVVYVVCLSVLMMAGG